MKKITLIALILAFFTNFGNATEVNVFQCKTLRFRYSTL